MARFSETVKTLSSSSRSFLCLAAAAAAKQADLLAQVSEQLNNWIWRAAQTCAETQRETQTRPLVGRMCYLGSRLPGGFRWGSKLRCRGGCVRSEPSMWRRS